MQDRDLDKHKGHSSVKSLARPTYKVIYSMTQEPPCCQLGIWDDPRHPNDCSLHCELEKVPWDEDPPRNFPGIKGKKN